MKKYKLDKKLLSNQINKACAIPFLANPKIVGSLVLSLVGANVTQSVLNLEDSPITSKMKACVFGVLTVESGLTIADIISKDKITAKIFDLCEKLEEHGIKVDYEDLRFALITETKYHGDNEVTNLRFIELHEALIIEEISNDDVTYRYTDENDYKDKQEDITDIVKKAMLIKK